MNKQQLRNVLDPFPVKINREEVVNRVWSLIEAEIGRRQSFEAAFKRAQAREQALYGVLHHPLPAVGEKDDYVGLEDNHPDSTMTYRSAAELRTLYIQALAELAELDERTKDLLRPSAMKEAAATEPAAASAEEKEAPDPCWDLLSKIPCREEICKARARAQLARTIAMDRAKRAFMSEILRKLARDIATTTMGDKPWWELTREKAFQLSYGPPHYPAVFSDPPEELTEIHQITDAKEFMASPDWDALVRILKVKGFSIELRGKKSHNIERFEAVVRF